jgi:hypothetical protein
MADVFIGSEALSAGVLSRGQLRWNYRSILPDVYMSKDATPSLSDRTVAGWLWSRRRAVIAGLTAAALHGVRGIDDSAEVELIWRCGRPPPGIVVRNERIEADETVEKAGLAVTTPARTALDLGKHLERNTAVEHLDSLARTTGITYADVSNLIDRYAGAPGVRRSAGALRLMDGGSRSSRETLVRLSLIDAGFPKPKTLAAGAIGYDAPRVGIGFDVRVAESFTRTGWMMIPAGTAQNPHRIVCLVRMAVIERGYPPWRLERVAGGRA